MYGAVAGAALAGLTVILVSRNGNSCCEQPQGHITFRESVGIVTIGSAAGAVVGAIFGYTYHFNPEPTK